MLLTQGKLEKELARRLRVSSMLRSIRLGVAMTAFALVLGSDQNVLAQWNSNSQETPLKEALRKDLQDYLDTRSTIEHISTLSMTVSFRGGSTISAAVGTTEYGGGERVTPNNVFQIGATPRPLPRCCFCGSKRTVFFRSMTRSVSGYRSIRRGAT